MKSIVLGGGLAMGLGLALMGCRSPEEQFRAADKEVYKILDQRHQDLFGEGKQYDINTAYSNREPEEIAPDEIIKDRFGGGGITNLLTLPMALEMAVGNSRQYQTQRESVYLSALSLTGERHKFALRFTSASVDLERTKSNGKPDTTSDASFTLSKAMKAGGSLTASLANDLTLYFDGSSPKVPNLTLALTQPLLKDAGQKMAQELLTQAERNLVYSIRSYTRYQQTFLVDLTATYLDLLRQKNKVRDDYSLYLDRIRFRQEQELRLKGELISQYELDQALRSELSAKDGYIASVASYRGSLDDFKKDLNLPLGRRIVLDDSEMDNLKQLPLDLVPLTDRYGYQLAMTNRLDVLNEIDKFQDKKRKVEVAKNDLLPSLKIVADYSLKDQYYRVNEFDFGDYSAKAGIALDLPIDKLSERNSYRQSRINFEQQLRSLMKTLDDLRDEVRTNLRTMDLNQRSYILQQKQLIVSRRELEKAQLDLLAGQRNVTPRDILEAQTAVNQSQSRVNSSLINFHVQRLRLLNNTGILNTAQPEWWRRPQVVPGLPPPPSAPPGVETDRQVPSPEDVLGN